ncbi:hypothetical protein [Streptomyces sp. NPDC002394]
MGSQGPLTGRSLEGLGSIGHGDTLATPFETDQAASWANASNVYVDLHDPMAERSRTLSVGGRVKRRATAAGRRVRGRGGRRLAHTVVGQWLRSPFFRTSQEMFIVQ